MQFDEQQKAAASQQQPAYAPPIAAYSIPINANAMEPPVQQLSPPTQTGQAEPSRRTSFLDRIPILKGDTERQGFVRKVYALLFIQLAITSAFVGAAVASQTLRDFMRANAWLYFVTAFGALAISFSLYCFYGAFKRVPTNYILLFTFTLLESYSVAVITSFYTPMSVLAAGLITLVMTLSLSLYACFTKSDFTRWYHGLLWVFIGTSLTFIIFIVIYPSSYLFFIFSLVIVILVSIFIIVDTQLIMGGQRYGLTYDDYVLAVLLLYTDIITLFIYILSLFGSRD